MPDPAILRYDLGLPVYRYGMAPGGLSTARQLRQERLSPAGLKPAAWLYYSRLRHLTCALYDRAAARPVRPLSGRQREALAAGRALANTTGCRRCSQARVPVWGSLLCEACEPVVQAERLAEWERRQDEAAAALAKQVAADRASAAAWAAGILADPGAVVLDTETTGLYDARIVEVAVVAAGGQVLLDTLVDPGVAIPADATAIHGITDGDVRDAPTFAQLIPRLARALHGKRVVIYNAAFDTGVLRGELDRYYRAAQPQAAPESWLTHPAAKAWLGEFRAECAMEQHARWFGEWSDYWGDYRWQRLDGGHRARGDCEATIRRLQAMAASPGLSDDAGDGWR